MHNSPSLIELSEKIARIEARQQIEQALRDYMRGQDRLLPEVQKRAFHADGYVNCGLFAGNALDFIDFAQGFLADCECSQHLIGQMDITFDSQTQAQGEIYFIAQHRIHTAGQAQDLLVAGRYKDRYEQRDGSWKIAHREEYIDWARTDNASDSFLNDPVLLRGSRGEQG